MTSLFKGFCLCFVIIFAEIASGQQCQQQCSNDYDACTATANQQFAQEVADCLASKECQCPPGGCHCTVVNGSQVGCGPLTPSEAELQFESDYNFQLSICQSAYNICKADCGAFEIGRNMLRPKGAVCLAKATDDAGWARMEQSLSGGGKRKIIWL